MASLPSRTSSRSLRKKDNTLFESVSGTVSNGSGVRGFAGRSANGITRNFPVHCYRQRAGRPHQSASAQPAMTVVQMNTVSPNGNVQSLAHRQPGLG
ncbi:MAG: hypothetical protein R3F17_01150 [Planctomycetota bacterium]